MRPNNRKLCETAVVLKSNNHQRCYFSQMLYGCTLTEAGRHQRGKQSSKSTFAHSIICFNAVLNYSFLSPLLSNLA